MNITEIISSEFFLKFMKYAVVGVVGMAVDFSVTFIFKEKINVSKYLANSLGFSVSVICNYVLNRYWTFNTTGEDVFIQFGTFLLVSIVGLFINNFIVYSLNEKLKVNFYVSKLFAIGTVVLWNFFMNYYYTFRSTI